MITNYEPAMQEEWDDFVNKSPSGTIFQTQKFLGYHPKGRFKDSSLIFKKENKIVSVFPATSQITNNYKILCSHPGASYGAPIFSERCNIELTIEVIDNLIYYAKKNKFNKIEMRLTPHIYHSYPSENLEYALCYHGFKMESIELASVVSLISETEESLRERFKRNTIRSVVKARRDGISIKESEKFEEFWTILDANLADKHETVATHNIDEIRLLKKLFPDKIKLFGAYYKENIIAGTVLFVSNDITCDAFYISLNYDYKKMAPLYLLLFEVIKWAHINNFRYFNFGISTEDHGKIVNNGLCMFKAKFGGRGIVRRRYSLEI